jgi:hypothetical protein
MAPADGPAARDLSVTTVTGVGHMPQSAPEAGPTRRYARTPGAVAEWLRSGLQSRVHRFNSGRRLQSEPAMPVLQEVLRPAPLRL